MATIRALAPAKINLTLHVTGQRDDGYHLLDSLVVFVDVADEIEASLAPELSLTVSGPFAQGVPTDATNLIMRAALALQKARGVTQGAAMTLKKSLPHAAGIGSGSADAAAALGLLAKLWKVAPLPPSAPEIVTLGADVPVCLHAPRPTRMSGIGDVLADIPPLPDAALVLVRPPVDVPTQSVFRGLKKKDGRAMSPLSDRTDFAQFAAWLAAQRNDLLATARTLAPEIGTALAKLDAMPAVAATGMSGSGATCFGLVKDMAAARQAARILQLSQMGWWVAPAAILAP
ncbi:4-(cytidine 5'-diphospho)-2-C-methyl-D-erythritol kinase [Yoonia sp. SS1-5]|uniref:4-diphosphocytidyl-2-C-methyl-D-erythritol kinase n=1 Tax=Yoonia rhodophyticola TaxID=3137370 RepID=A0AAN0MFD9_9RHOB